MNLFDPDVAHPLQEGEWLHINDSNRFQRGFHLTGPVAPAGGVAELTLVDVAANTASPRPCFMYFQERGRYDAQVTRKAHCIVGPGNYEFRTKQIVCSTGEEGDRCFVYIAEDSAGRLVSALASETAADALSNGPVPTGAWYAGVILRIHGTNDATVLFQPGYHE
jgi:hypothetical protein